MKQTILLVLLVECGMTLLASCDKKTPSPSLPTPDARVAYELREKCGKDASEWFKREHGNDAMADDRDIATIQDEYTNHYSSKLSQCYALVLIAALIHPVKGKEVNTKSATLVDVNENKEIGRYFANSESGPPVKCSVGDSQCGSLAEWHALTTPYMNQ